MASKTLITPEQYLATPYDWEPDYVHGELVEKPLPNRVHGGLQQRLGVLLDHAGYCCVEVRHRLAEDLFRRPDVLLFEGAGPTELVPKSPPMVIVEITSPDDTVHELLEKCEEYRVWSVPNIWVVEPEPRKFYVYTAGLKETTQFELPADRK